MIRLHIFDMDGTLIDNDCDVSWKLFLVRSGIAPRDDLELADRFYENREADASADPFARTAVVVPTPLRGDWLKARFLLDREPGRRRILANLDVAILHPFVNDWLSAAVDGVAPADRRPAEHPYSKEMLQWRIDGILAASPDDFPVLARYFGEREADRPVRRFALAGKLAEMIDDYQVHMNPITGSILMLSFTHS